MKMYTNPQAVYKKHAVPHTSQHTHKYTLNIKTSGHSLPNRETDNNNTETGKQLHQQICKQTKNTLSK